MLSYEITDSTRGIRTYLNLIGMDVRSLNGRTTQSTHDHIQTSNDLQIQSMELPFIDLIIRY